MLFFLFFFAPPHLTTCFSTTLYTFTRVTDGQWGVLGRTQCHFSNHRHLSSVREGVWNGDHNFSKVGVQGFPDLQNSVGPKKVSRFQELNCVMLFAMIDNSGKGTFPLMSFGNPVIQTLFCWESKIRFNHLDSFLTAPHRKWESVYTHPYM